MRILIITYDKYRSVLLSEGTRAFHAMDHKHKNITLNYKKRRKEIMLVNH